MIQRLPPRALPIVYILTVALSSITLTSSVWAQGDKDTADDAPPDLFGAANVAAPYAANDSLVERTLRSGLPQEAWRVLDAPETSNGMRAALIDAAARSGRNPRMATVYLRRLTSQHGTYDDSLTLDDLATHELFVFGLMLAHQHPTTLTAAGGDHEVARATPLLLLNSAANRHRGDLAIRLALAMVKAQRALNDPDQILCAPHDCIDHALAPFPTEWSVHPEAVCAMVDAVAAHTSPKADFKARQTCEDVSKGGASAPAFAERESLEAGTPPTATAQNKGRFSKPTPRGQIGAGAKAQAQRLAQQEVLIDQAIADLRRQKQMLNASEQVMVEFMIQELERQKKVIAMHRKRIAAAAPPPRAAPSSVSTQPRARPQQPTPSDQKDGEGIEFDSGSRGSSNGEIILTPQNAQP